MIDWKNPKENISKFFTVGEATYLPSIKEYYHPTELEADNIIHTAKKMDEIRELLGCPIKVHVWIRPILTSSGINYNEFVGGSKNSAHIMGQAVDFSTKKYTVDQIMDILQPKCSELCISLENNGSMERIVKNGGTGLSRNWVHVQTRPLLNGDKFRIFNP